MDSPTRDKSSSPWKRSTPTPAWVPLEDGFYSAMLVSVAEKSSRNERYWQWEFSSLVDQEQTPVPGSYFLDVHFSKPWLMFQIFRAFGRSATTNTDEMIGGRTILRFVGGNIWGVLGCPLIPTFSAGNLTVARPGGLRWPRVGQMRLPGLHA